MVRLFVVMGAVLGLAACGTTGGADAPAPDFSPIASQSVSPNGRLVLACVSQALGASHTDMIGDDGDSRLIRFTCDGSPAKALFDALGPRSAAIDSEWSEGAVVHRSTERIQRNLYGADVCSRDGQTYRCVFNLNLGGFVRE